MWFPKFRSLVVSRVLAAVGRKRGMNQFKQSPSGRQRRAVGHFSHMVEMVECLEDRALLSALNTAVPVNDLSGTITIDQASTTENIAASKDGDIHVAYGGSQVRVTTSLDRGSSFQPSVLLANTPATYVAVEAQGTDNVYVAWVSNGSAFVSVSTDSGATFSAPQTVTTNALFFRGINLAVVDSDVYIQGSSGDNSEVFHNGTDGIGAYAATAVDSLANRKLEVDPTDGAVYSIGDYSDLFVAKSTDSGATFSADSTPSGGPSVFFSTTALSFGPSGKFAFVAGNNRNGNVAAKIDLTANTATSINIGNNSGNSQGRSLAADAVGNVIDSYNEAGVMKYRVSQNLGTSFASAVTVGAAISSNVAINPAFQDVLVLYQVGSNLFLSTYQNELLFDSPPVLASAGSINYTENDSATAIDSGITVTDSDNSTLFRATVSLTNFVSSQDVLAFTNNGSTMGNITASFNSSTGVLSLRSSGMTATKAEWQAALRAVTYANTSDTPTTTTRSVDFVINDGTELSNTLTSTVAITAVNDVPVAQTSSATTNEDIPKTFASSDFLFSDAESNSLASVTVSNLTLASGDTLTVNQGSGPVTVTNGMTVTAAQLVSLTYTSASNANGAAARVRLCRRSDLGRSAGRREVAAAGEALPARRSRATDPRAARRGRARTGARRRGRARRGG